MSEASDRDFLLRKFFKFGFFQLVENNVGRGTPDCIFAYEGHMHWVEFKNGRKAKLRAEQFNWMEQLLLEGVNSIIVSREAGSMLVWVFDPKEWDFDGVRFYFPCADPLEFTEAKDFFKFFKTLS